MIAEIVPAAPEHVAFIADNARQADIDELWAAACSTPERAMRTGIKFGDFTRTGLADGVPVCMWGVVKESLIGNVGVPWMVGSNDLDRLAIPFLRRNGAEIAKMFDAYDRLFNYIDARNTKAIRWLKWLGFVVDAEAKPYGFYQMPFHRFWRSYV